MINSFKYHFSGSHDGDCRGIVGHGEPGRTSKNKELQRVNAKLSPSVISFADNLNGGQEGMEK